MGLTCGLFILVALVTTISAAPFEEENIKRMLEDLRILEDLRLFEELEGTLSRRQFGSLSGIEVDRKVATFYDDMKVRHTKKWCTLKIENKQKVIVDECREGDPELNGDKDKTAFNDMTKLLTREPRYILYDICFVNYEGSQIQKLFFLFWCPEDSKIGDKMLYMSMKDAIKKEFTGLSVDFQANDRADLNYDEYKKVVERS